MSPIPGPSVLALPPHNLRESASLLSCVSVYYLNPPPCAWPSGHPQSVTSSLRSAVTHNQQMISAGANFLLLNGIAVDVNSLDFYGRCLRVAAGRLG